MSENLQALYTFLGTQGKSNRGIIKSQIEISHPFPEVDELKDILGNGILSLATTTNNKRITHEQIYQSDKMSKQQIT